MTIDQELCCGCYILPPCVDDIYTGPIFLPQRGAQVRAKLVDDFACEVKLTLQFEYDGVSRGLLQKRVSSVENAPVSRLKYALPLDENAAVCEFKADIGGRKLSAKVQEKKQARRTFEKALRQGKRAALLERDPSNADTFTVELGALPGEANSLITIEVTYIAELRFEGDNTVFELPTAVAPLRRMLGEKTPESGHCGSMALNELGVATAKSSPMNLDFELKAVTSSPVQDIRVEGGVDGAEVNLEAEGGAEVSLKQAEFGGMQAGSRTLRVLLRLEETQAQGAIEYSPEHESVATRVTLCARQLEIDEALELPCELIFLVDKSGSMYGDAMSSVKETLQVFLRSLPSNARFNIIAFDSSYSSCFSKSQPLTQKSRDDADAFVRKLRASGGTDILRPLQNLFKQTVDPAYPRQIFLLTDGQVSNRDACVRCVATHAGEQRVFAFGLGGGVDRALVRGIADAGKGTAAFINKPSEAGDLVMTLLVAALQPPVSSLNLAYPPALEPTQRVPEQLPQTLFPGTEQSRQCLYSVREDVSVSQWKQLMQQQQESCVLTGVLHQPEGDKLSRDFALELPLTEASVRVGSTIHRLMARRRIKELEQLMEKGNSDVYGELAMLGVRYQLACSAASFVAVDETPKEEPEEPEIDDICMGDDDGDIRMVDNEASVCTRRQSLQDFAVNSAICNSDSDYSDGFSEDDDEECDDWGSAEAEVCSSAPVALNAAPMQLRSSSLCTGPVQQQQQEVPKSKGFFGRLRNAFSPSPSASAAPAAECAAPAPAEDCLADSFSMSSYGGAPPAPPAAAAPMRRSAAAPVSFKKESAERKKKRSVARGRSVAKVSEERKAAPKPTVAGDATLMSTLVKAQALDGSWSLTSLPADLQAQADKARALLGGNADDATVATLLALALLTKKCAAQRAQWAMPAGKARRVLQQNSGLDKNGVNALVEQLVAQLN